MMTLSSKQRSASCRASNCSLSASWCDSEFLSEAAQLSLFQDTETAHRVSAVMDKINARFRRGAITKGRTLIHDDSQ